jgi:hypothetical protein
LWGWGGGVPRLPSPPTSLLRGVIRGVVVRNAHPPFRVCEYTPIPMDTEK